MTSADYKIHIRKADRESDADLLCAIARETFVSTYGDLYAPKDIETFLADQHSPAAYRRLIGNPAYGLWLATDRDAPVAYAVAGPCRLPAPDMAANAGEIKRIYVSATQRSGGLGGRLMDCMLVWLGENFGDVYVSVFSENGGAQRFYARYGFQKVHEYLFKVGDQRDREWIMKRSSQPRGNT